VKHEFFNKAILSGKPFIMLLPIQFLTAKKSYENILNCKMDMIIFNPSPVFINQDKNRAVGDCAWMLVNLTVGGAFSVQRLSNNEVVKLGCLATLPN
jgi:hypothetical protein